jgi:hypothetical protein
MPKSVDPRFLRERTAALGRIGIVVPENATMEPEIEERLRSPELRRQLNSVGIEMDPDIGRPTKPPSKFSFHYIPYPPDASLLEDGATLDNGIYKFAFRDAVIGVFDLPLLQDDEF